MFVGREDDASGQIVPMAGALSGPARTSATRSTPAVTIGAMEPRLNQMLILASQDVTHPLRSRERVPNDARVFAGAPGAALRAAPPPGRKGAWAPALRRGSPRAPAPRRPRVPPVHAVQPPRPAASPFPLVPALACAAVLAALVALFLALRRRGLAGVLLLPVCLLAGIGLLYALRGLRLVRARSAHPGFPAATPARRVRRPADRAGRGRVAADRLRLRPRRSARETALARPRGGGVRSAVARGGVQRLVCARRQSQADGRPLAPATTPGSVARGGPVRASERRCRRRMRRRPDRCMHRSVGARMRAPIPSDRGTGAGRPGRVIDHRPATGLRTSSNELTPHRKTCQGLTDSRASAWTIVGARGSSPAPLNHFWARRPDNVHAGGVPFCA